MALNDVVGSGVYLLPAAAAALLGPASLWAVFLAGAAVLLIVLCFAEASSRFDQPGSAYLYARTAFGGLAGTEVGLMSWLTRVASIASLSAGFAQAVSYLWPGAAEGWWRAAVIALPLTALTAVNVVGVAAGVSAAMALLAGKLLPLLFFLAAGLPRARWETFAAQPEGEGRIGEAALLLLFAYAGFENTPAAAGEYRNPRRDVPFALMANIVIVTLLYAGTQWVALGVLPSASSSDTPLADAAERFAGRWAGVLMTVGAGLSILGTNSNSVLTGPRYLLALARDGVGPAALAAVHPRFRTPVTAILLQGAITLPLALTGTFTGLAALSVVARLASYLATAAAVPVLRRKLGDRPGTLRLPLGPAIPLAAAAVTLALAASATGRHLLTAGLVLLAGALLHLLRRR
ncbi:MAG TPA: APC family permease [Candidatus Polarisedimenticolia bacterium]|nr:APC family permease [Candidatus Polarisedimenticolia bacterium]